VDCRSRRKRVKRSEWVEQKASMIKHHGTELTRSTVYIEHVVDVNKRSERGKSRVLLRCADTEGSKCSQLERGFFLFVPLLALLFLFSFYITITITISHGHGGYLTIIESHLWRCRLKLEDGQAEARQGNGCRGRRPRGGHWRRALRGMFSFLIFMLKRGENRKKQLTIRSLCHSQ